MSFFCLWIPQFPAWALAQSRPELTESPFMVCDKGEVVAVSPLAAKAGIRAGMLSARAHALCDGVKLLPRDLDNETLAWGEVQRTLANLTPRVEALEPGLLFAAVDGTMASSLVHHWGAHGGQATDRATAHLAALCAARQEVRCVRRGREESFANRVAIETLLDAGLSRQSLKLLKKYGYVSVGSVRDLTEQQLQEQFESDSDRLFSLSRGAQHQPNLWPVSGWTSPEEIVATFSFPAPAVESAEWEAALDSIVAKACEQLGQRAARSLEIVAQTAINPIASRLLLESPVYRANEFKMPARLALKEAFKELFPLPPVLTGLEVRLGAFVARPASADTEEAGLWEKAVESVESYLERVGAEAGMAWRVYQKRHNPLRRSTWSWRKESEQAPAHNSCKRFKAVPINTIQGDVSTLDAVGCSLGMMKAGR